MGDPSHPAFYLPGQELAFGEHPRLRHAHAVQDRRHDVHERAGLLRRLLHQWRVQDGRLRLAPEIEDKCATAADCCPTTAPVPPLVASPDGARRLQSSSSEDGELNISCAIAAGCRLSLPSNNLAPPQPLEKHAPWKNGDPVRFPRPRIERHEDRPPHAVILSECSESAEVVRRCAIGRLDLDGNILVAKHEVDLEPGAGTPVRNVVAKPE